MSLGIDVSDYQPNVDWLSVSRSGISFAFVKATEGASFVADTFARNWTQMKTAGVIRGAYHFFRANRDAQVQADLFLKTVKLEPGDLPAVLDIESSDGVDIATLVSRAKQWLSIVEQKTGRKPIIYTFPSFWERIGNPKSFAEYPLWVAHYTNADQPWVPGGWRSWEFWQYTDRGSVAGVAGGVDVNVFNSAVEGSIGSHVTTIQKCLQNKGFSPGSVDGIFGPATKTAVLAFQNAVGLKADGVVGIQTWATLMDMAQPVKVQPTPTPSPVVASPAIRLVDVSRFYQGKSHQDRALLWLQSQIPASVMSEFARRWRNQSSTQGSDSIRLIDVARFYQGLSNQTQALDWLQSRLSGATLGEFARQWRSEVQPQWQTIRLLDVCKFYQGSPTQAQAIEWLQSQVSPVVLDEFARRWRS